jgi:hypothetical protein
MRIVYCVSLVFMSAWPSLAAFSQERVTVRPEEIDEVLVNPGIGL